MSGGDASTARSSMLRTRSLRRRVIAVALGVSVFGTVVMGVLLATTVTSRLQAVVDRGLDNAQSQAFALDAAGADPATIVNAVATSGVFASMRVGNTTYVANQVAVGGSTNLVVAEGNSSRPVEVTNPGSAANSSDVLVGTGQVIVGTSGGNAEGAATPVPGEVVVGSSNTTQDSSVAVPGGAVQASPVPVDGSVATAAIPVGSGTVGAQTDSAADNLSYRTLALPRAGGTLTLSAATDVVSAATGEVLKLLAIGAVLVFVIAGLALRRLVNVTLSPLDDMADAATAIAGGQRGRRLNPDTSSTELGRTATAFDAMVDSLEQSEERLRDFTADAAHELRTPVTAVAVTAENLLQHSDDPARVEQAAYVLVRESHRAARLLGNLTGSLALDGGRSDDIALTEVDLVRVARESVVRCEQVNGSGALPTMAVAAVVEPVVVRTDVGQVAQILANLLDNAIRFTPADGSIEMFVDRDASGAAVIRLQDSGIGIPEHERERIFERLVRLQPDRARESGGSGLGLAISRGLARNLGGDLVCRARPDGQAGACFELTLPS